VLDDAGAIGAVRELQVENLCVLLRLLQTIRCEPVLAFGLDDRQRSVAQVREEVVGALALAAADGPAGDDDSARCEADLLTDLVVSPPGRIEAGNDIGTAGVSFGRNSRALGSGASRFAARLLRVLSIAPAWAADSELTATWSPTSRPRGRYCSQASASSF
jgi:hypothetical protein